MSLVPRYCPRCGQPGTHFECPPQEPHGDTVLLSALAEDYKALRAENERLSATIVEWERLAPNCEQSGCTEKATQHVVATAVIRGLEHRLDVKLCDEHSGLAGRDLAHAHLVRKAAAP